MNDFSEQLSYKNSIFKRLFGIFLLLTIVVGGVVLARLSSRRYPDISQYIVDQKIAMLVSEHDFSGALNLLTGDDSKSYYNRGVVRFSWAYSLAGDKELSGLQEAQSLIDQANKDFDSALQLQLDDSLTLPIRDNQHLTQNVAGVVEIKTCYKEYTSLLSGLDNLVFRIQDVKNLIIQEQNVLLLARSFFDAHGMVACFDRLTRMLSQTSDQLLLLEREISGYKSKYISRLGDLLKSPDQCFNEDLSPLLVSLQKYFESMDEYLQSHSLNIGILRRKDIEVVKQLCEQSTDDGHINEKMDSRLQSLLRDLEGKQNQSPSDEGSGFSQTIQYQDFNPKEIQKSLDTLYEKNQKVLQEMNQVKRKGNYDPLFYLRDVFDQFFGHEKDFK